MSLYDVLLVGQNATSEEIKLAFKRRALQVHPDKGGSKEDFHLVYQALETLGDPAARQKYDHSLATACKRLKQLCIQSQKRRREKVNLGSRPRAAKQRQNQSLRRLERSPRPLLANLQVQVNLHKLQLRQQNRNPNRPSC